MRSVVKGEAGEFVILQLFGVHPRWPKIGSRSLMLAGSNSSVKDSRQSTSSPLYQVV
jgi:hypothetical protein